MAHTANIALQILGCHAQTARCLEPLPKTYLMKSTVVISERNSDIWTHDIGFAQVFSSWEEADNAAKILAKMVGFDVYVKQHE